MDSTKIKVFLSVIIVVLAAFVTVVMGSTVSAYEKENGLIIDFGGRSVVWAPMDLESENPFSMLEKACDSHDFDLDIADESVKSIDGKPAVGSSAKWEFWVVNPGTIEWRKVTADLTDLDPSDYSALCWALCKNGEYPSMAVDQTGVNAYGYVGSTRLISLSPAITETICSIGLSNRIVGADNYSTYPSYIANAKERGDLESIGGFTNPSFEAILALNPSLVVCDGGVASHKVMAEKLRDAGVCVLVLYDGEDVDTILDNIMLVGAATNKTDASKDAIDEILSDIDSVKGSLSGGATFNVLVTLDSSSSPWVAGKGTYISDIINLVYSHNVLESVDNEGWFTLSMETMGLTYNPDYIIILSDNEVTTACEENYDYLISHLDEFWMATSAYADGNIYWLTDGAVDLGSRPGPRVGQMVELLSNILYTDDIPKYVGDNYVQYLTYSVDLGW